MIYFVASLIICGIFFFLYQNYLAMADFKARFDEPISDRFDKLDMALQEISSERRSCKPQIIEIRDKFSEIRLKLNELSQEIAVMHNSMNHTNDVLVHRIGSLCSVESQTTEVATEPSQACKPKCKSKRGSEAS